MYCKKQFNNRPAKHAHIHSKQCHILQQADYDRYIQEGRILNAIPCLMNISDIPQEIKEILKQYHNTLIKSPFRNELAPYTPPDIHTTVATPITSQTTNNTFVDSHIETSTREIKSKPTDHPGLNYGEEDYSCIKRPDVITSLRHGARGVTNLFIQVFMNDKYPHNMTIRYASRRAKTFWVHVDGEWEQQKIDVVLEPILQKLQTMSFKLLDEMRIEAEFDSAMLEQHADYFLLMSVYHMDHIKRANICNEIFDALKTHYDNNTTVDE
jgi:hypothetical protein